MLKKTLLIIMIFVVAQQSIISQIKDTCDKPIEDPLMELNSITKCSIEEEVDTKKSSSKNIQVSTRRRIVRKRDAAKGISNTSANHKIANIKDKASLVGSLELGTEGVLEKIPFNVVDEIPLFNACERSPISEQEKCFKQEISSHIIKNFKYPEKAYDKSIQGRVYIQFLINKIGDIEDIKVKGPKNGELLENEALRIINLLPKFKAGKHYGKKVKVKYGLPIAFKIPGRKRSNI